MQFRFKNMSCAACARAITHAIHTAFPAAKLEIDLPSKTVRVSAEASAAQILGVLATAGYPAEPAAEPAAGAAHNAGSCCPTSMADRLRSCALALIAGVASMFASPDSQASGALSDMWWSSANPGWALTLEHRTERNQGIIVERGYATLTSHDASGDPVWHSVSLASAGYRSNGLPVLQGPVFSTLRAVAAGEADGGVETRQVGYMHIEPISANALMLEYELDGVRRSTRIERFSALLESLDGHYSAAASLEVTSVGQLPRSTLSFGRVLVSSSGDQVELQEIGDRGVCGYRGAMRQWGRALEVTGTYRCDDGRAGSFELTEVVSTAHGFSGRLQRSSGQETVSGKLAWVRIGA